MNFCLRLSKMLNLLSGSNRRESENKCVHFYIHLCGMLESTTNILEDVIVQYREILKSAKKCMEFF